MGTSGVVVKSLSANSTSIPPILAEEGVEIVMVIGGGFYRNRSTLKWLRNKISVAIGAMEVLYSTELPTELNHKINLS